MYLWTIMLSSFLTPLEYVSAVIESIEKSNTNQWTTKPPKLFLPYGAIYRPHQMHHSFGWPHSPSQMAAQLLHMVLQSYTTNSPFITMGHPLCTSKIIPIHGPPFNTCFFLDQHNPLPQMAFQLPQPFFQNTLVFNRPSDRPTDRANTEPGLYQ